MKTLYTAYAVTVSDIASGPPSGASTGDIWIATNVDTNGTRWQFQYNAGSSSTYKWEFIGGSPVRVTVPAFENVAYGTANAWVDTTTVGPSYTTVRAGDYLAYVQSAMTHSIVNTKVQVGSALGAGAPPDSSGSYLPVATGYNELSIWNQHPSLSAGQEIRVRYSATATGTLFNGNRVLMITPVRVA